MRAIDAPCTQCLRHGDPMHAHTPVVHTPARAEAGPRACPTKRPEPGAWCQLSAGRALSVGRGVCCQLRAGRVLSVERWVAARTETGICGSEKPVSVPRRTEGVPWSWWSWWFCSITCAGHTRPARHGCGFHAPCPPFTSHRASLTGAAVLALRQGREKRNVENIFRTLAQQGADWEEHKATTKDVEGSVRQIDVHRISFRNKLRNALTVTTSKPRLRTNSATLVHTTTNSAKVDDAASALLAQEGGDLAAAMQKLLSTHQQEQSAPVISTVRNLHAGAGVDHSDDATLTPQQPTSKRPTPTPTPSYARHRQRSEPQP
eukprot:COSAG01_NODE_7960_length_2970_cov_1.416203_1_plen_318_part_00